MAIADLKGEIVYFAISNSTLCKTQVQDTSKIHRMHRLCLE